MRLDFSLSTQPNLCAKIQSYPRRWGSSLQSPRGLRASRGRPGSPGERVLGEPAPDSHHPPGAEALFGKPSIRPWGPVASSLSGLTLPEAPSPNSTNLSCLLAPSSSDSESDITRSPVREVAFRGAPKTAAAAPSCPFCCPGAVGLDQRSSKPMGREAAPLRNRNGHGTWSAEEAGSAVRRKMNRGCP